MTLPLLPCGHRTRHGQSIGCCGGCRRLFSSDTAFAKHRKGGSCLDPESVGLMARDSHTAPGETVWGHPAAEHRLSSWRSP